MKFVGALVLSLLCGGCFPAAWSSYEPTGAPPHPMRRKMPSEVQVVMPPVRAAGVEVGKLEATSDPSYSWEPQTQETLGLLRQEAAARGCDAIEPDPADTELFMMGSTPMRRTTQSARCFVTP